MGRGHHTLQGILKISEIFLLLFFLCEKANLAETIYGKVSHVNPQKSEVEIKSPGKYRYLPKQVHLIFTKQTDFQGLDSIHELEEGDDIVVDAYRTDPKRWVVKAVAPLSRPIDKELDFTL